MEERGAVLSAVAGALIPGVLWWNPWERRNELQAAVIPWPATSDVISVWMVLIRAHHVSSQATLLPR